MSDTPRTRKAECHISEYRRSGFIVDSDFARELERENAALREDKERLETALRFYADKSHLYETRGAFVENNEHRYCPDGAIVEHGAVARAAIDAARKEGK